jgi:hypothetical protein
MIWGGHLLDYLFSCGVCQIMANRYESAIFLLSLTVKNGSFVREGGFWLKGHNMSYIGYWGSLCY